MIKTTMVAMTLLGCDCDAKVCEYISETPAQWANVAECEAAMSREVLNSRDLSYPLVSGLCRSIDAAPAAVPTVEEKPAIVMEAGLEVRRPAADILPTTASQSSRDSIADLARDGGGVVFRRTADGYATVKGGVMRAIGGTAGAITRTAAGWLPGL